MKIPKKWNDLSIKQFIELTEVKETGNEITDFINKLQVFTNKNKEELEKITYKEILVFNRSLSFMKKLPAELNKKYFIHNLVLYKRKSFENLINEDFIDLNGIIENETNEGIKLAKIISIIYKPNLFYKKKNKHTDFLNMKLGVAYGCSLFFCSIVKDCYLKYLETCLEGLMKLKGKELVSLEMTTKKKVSEIISSYQKLILKIKNGDGTSLS